MTKHNVINGPTIVYDETVTSNTYVEGDYFTVGTVNQLVFHCITAINAPATKVLLKIQSTEGTFDYDYAPPDLANATVVGNENQIPLNTDVYVIDDGSQVVWFSVPFSGPKFRVLAKTDNAAGEAAVVVRCYQVVV